ncbi:hypothetical protein [Kitasatospora sp. KL5]|uniref:hypothetical protein n=1 Tax=Kitasatospora sp. KL5 TaxID=3425125 RepID=UPI003D6FCACD
MTPARAAQPAALPKNGLRTLLAVVLTTLLAAVLAGCGSTVTGQGTRPDAAEIPWTVMGVSAVDAVRTTPDGRSLVVDVKVPSGAENCTRGLTGEVTGSRPGAVDVRITFESRSMDRSSGCTSSEAATVEVPLPAPVGDRTVLVGGTHSFTAAGATPPALRRCGELGCNPAPTGCTADSYRQALTGADSPQHTGWTVRGCDGHWLVLDLSAPTGPVCGDPGPGCDNHVRTTRWFYRAAASGWTAVTSAGGAGCTAVQRVEPAFPTALCKDLGAVPAAG